MNDTVLAVLAASYGVVMALAPGLQIVRILRLRSSRDVSIGYLAVITFGFVIWIAYGAAIERPALVIPNSVALLVGVVTIAVAVRFRSGPTAADRPSTEAAVSPPTEPGQVRGRA